LFVLTGGEMIFAQGRQPPPPPPPAMVIPPFISGYVLVPDEAQFKAEGIEVRLMFCVGECPTGHVGSGTAFAIPAGTSVYTDTGGRFFFNETSLGLLDRRTFTRLYLNIVLEGYAELTEEVHPNASSDYLHSAGNVLMLNRGPSDGLDLTHREPMPLTRVEAMREELVRQYNELSVREYEQGLRDELNRKTENAISHFRKSTEAAPAFYDAWMQLGTAQKEATHLDGAILAYRRAAAINPNAGEPLIGIAEVLLDQAGDSHNAGNLDAERARYLEVVAQLQQAVLKAPWSSDAYYYLGSAFYKLNQFSGAESALRTSLDKTTPRQDARLMLVNLYLKQKRYPEALNQLDEYLKAVPKGPQRTAAEQIQATLRKALQSPNP
jgi:tetratricopeptide (TPR) repeat protein